MKPMLVYFSRDGSTRLLAEMIAGKMDADLQELREEKPRRGFLVSGFRSATGRKPRLAAGSLDGLKDRDQLILGAPIWAGNGNPVLNSFISEADLSGKAVVLFTVQADPRKKGADKVLQLLAGAVRDRGGKVTDSRAFHGSSPGKTALKESLQQQLEDWNPTFSG